ncbi:MAG TPA: hypothetical protein VG713_22130, partial [Pirellulales bacterium]|nr:hypothetical protein [Pirellulales bacterium]
LYRVGGLQARNERGQPDDLHSVAEVGRFDPATKQWSPLPDLPEGRSSHDAVVVGRALYVVGGWELGSEKAWIDHACKLSLDDPDAGWKAVPQDFRRRALSIAAAGGKLYAIGGMTENNEPSTDVRVMDLKTDTWSQGPALPGKPIEGFGCAALALDGRVYVSTMDGSVVRLSASGDAWDPVAHLKQPRFFHRMLAANDRTLLVIAGASMQVGHLKSIEPVSIGQ